MYVRNNKTYKGEFYDRRNKKWMRRRQVQSIQKCPMMMLSEQWKQGEMIW
jgi:hypothetical protein